MIQLKAYKYRIYPNKEQEQFLLMNLGCARFVWNQLTSAFNSWSHTGPNPQVNEKMLKDIEEYSFLRDAISYVLQQKRMDFDELKKQYFNKKRAVKIGRPRFKKRGNRESFRIPAASMYLEDFEDISSGLKLPKLASRIKIVIDREFNGKPKSITVSKTPSGHYFVSVLVEEDVSLLPTTHKSVGIDLGLIDLITTSDGVKIPAFKVFRKNQAKLAKAQRHLSRKVKGSNRRKRQRIKVARIYQKITDIRKWHYHNISTALARDYDEIFMEDLNVKGMIRNHRLAKSIQDASFSTLVSMIEYKCRWYGKTFHKVDRWFASSKTCSSCGHKMEEMQLSVRSWECPSCGAHHNRDENAAINILHRGLMDLYDLTSAELADYRHRAELRREQETEHASAMKCLSSSICYRNE